MSVGKLGISLDALLIFEAAARFQNFNLAAQELNITRSAVSHQIAGLEKTLGARLFERSPLGVNLTSIGKDYFARLRGPLNEMHDVTADTFANRKRRKLTVYSAPTFSNNWLIKRLGRFLEANPDLDFTLVGSGKPADFRDPSIDLAIGYGEQEWLDCTIDLLASEKVQPLCSPAYLKQNDVRELYDLQRAALIRTSPNSISWETWLVDQGIKFNRAPRQLDLSPSFLALSAAADGFGFVLESNILASEYLASGQLVAPFDGVLRDNNAYFLVRPRDERRRNSRSFSEWILSEAASL